MNNNKRLFSVKTVYGNYFIQKESFYYDENDELYHLTLNNQFGSCNCPFCGKETSKLHQQYKRKIYDYIYDTNIMVTVNSRKFYCKYCDKIFTEHIPFTIGKSNVSVRVLYVITKKYTSFLKTKNMTFYPSKLFDKCYKTINKNTLKSLHRNTSLIEKYNINNSFNNYTETLKYEKKHIKKTIEFYTNNSLIEPLESIGPSINKLINKGLLFELPKIEDSVKNYYFEPDQFEKQET